MEQEKVTCYKAEQVLKKTDHQYLSIKERVQGYFTTVISVEKKVKEGFTVCTPIIGVYTTEITVKTKKKSRAKKSRAKKWLAKMFKLFH